MSTELNRTSPSSSFVTGVAWVFIALSGFGTVMSILQNILFHTVFNTPEMEKALHTAPPGTPPFAMFMFSHFALFFAAFFAMSVVTLAASIGLLKRENWARLFFIGLMVLSILWNLGGLALQFTMFSSMQDSIATVRGAPDMKIFFIGVATVSVLFALGFCGLFGWIAKRLLSARVIAEFRRSA